MFLSIFVTILILSFLVISHEFGHFIVAKKTGVKVEEFGIGYPPRIWGIKKGETIYSFNLIPFGGFVRLYGEERKEGEYEKDPRSFNAKSVKVKALILSAGVIMNFLVAVVIFYFLLGFSGFKSKQSLIFDYHFPFGKQENFVLVSFVAKNSPAEKIGLKPGTIILSINNQSVDSPEKVIQLTNQNKGKEILLKVKDFQSEEIRMIKVIPRESFPQGEGPLGIGIIGMSEISYNSFLEKMSVGFLHSANLLHYSVVVFGHLIKESFQKKNIKVLSSGVAGPIGILAMTKVTLVQGLFSVLNLLALISLALVMVNIIPFPALDGGRLFFLVLESVIGKKIPEKVEQKINLIGFVFLILLLILVTIKDVSQFGKLLF